MLKYSNACANGVTHLAKPITGGSRTWLYAHFQHDAFQLGIDAGIRFSRLWIDTSTDL